MKPDKALDDLKKESQGTVETQNAETVVYVDKEGKQEKAKVHW